MWPVLMLSFTASQNLVDVNVTPDKRTVFFHHEEDLGPGMCAPYQVRLDDGDLIFAPADHESCIRSATAPGINFPITKKTAKKANAKATGTKAATTKKAAAKKTAAKKTVAKKTVAKKAVAKKTITNKTTTKKATK